MLVPVDPRYPGAWRDLSPFLEDALNRGDGIRDWSLQDMLERASAGQIQLWAFVVRDEVRGAGLTCRTVYPRRAVLEILAFGADSGLEEEWFQELAWLKDMAKANGMSAIVGTGRPGWARRLGALEKRVFEIDVGV